jgi:hypothetical protein
MKIALTASVEMMEIKLLALPFVPYTPVQGQLRSLLRSINRKRKRAGLEEVPEGVLPARRYVVKPFD